MVNGARLAHFVYAGCGGIYAGFLLAVLVIELTLWDFDAAVYLQVEQVKHL